MSEIRINLIRTASLLGDPSTDPTLQPQPHHGSGARRGANQPRLSPEQVMGQTQTAPTKQSAQPQGLAHAMMTAQAPMEPRKKKAADHKRIPTFLDDESDARSHQEKRRDS